ncbi:MAG: ABC transporter permease [Bacteroidetes bacterium]|nr:ABC transporter permease [Bacteroidota bacterium]
MLRNYFLIAIRNLKKNKVFSFINILGLALGMTCSLLIFLWVQDEKSVNAFHANGNRLYSVYERQYYDKQVQASHTTPGLMADEMKRILPQVEYACQFAWSTTNTFQVGEKIQKEEGNHASADFFKIFSYPLVQGNVATALNSPVSIAISRKMANDFFGSAQNAIGKTIRYENKKDFTVSAVFENLSQHASEKFDFLINWQYFIDDLDWLKNWGNNGPNTFLVLKKGTDPIAFEKKIVHFLDNYNKDQSAGFHIELGIQRFDDMYLHSNFKNGKLSGGRIEYVRLFSVVAIFILLIACINFMNLTTARSMKRAKEIGIRKVVGAVRTSLIRQFIGEAILLAFLGVLFALVLTWLLLPSFNELTRKEISFPFSSFNFWLGIVALTLLTGFISGSYPAIFLSSFNPIKVLKGTLRFSSKAALFRKGLVVFQFVLSIVLIVGTIVITKQVNYIQTKNLGYDRENLLYIPMEGELINSYDVFKAQALKMPGVKSVTSLSQSPTSINNGTSGLDWDGKDPNVVTSFTWIQTNYDLIKTMNLKLVDGRDFSESFATDSSAYIINEEALKTLQYKNPIGRRLKFWGKDGTIIGVLKDFHIRSLHEPINPVVIRLGDKNSFGSILVRTEAGKTKQAIASLEALSKQLNPKFPFTYQFADEEFQKLYRSEQVITKLSGYFSFLAIFISCLGLLGLAIFTAEQRTKEIGIRKVLGASTSSLFTLLSKEFLQFVLIAIFIATPIAWWMMHAWLQDYSYRIDISWWIFILAGSMAILIALATISFQAIKAALANPVKSLRTE